MKPINLLFDNDKSVFTNDHRGRREQDQRPLLTKQDPLALSWASYAVWLRDPRQRWVSLDDVQAHDHDFEMASITRRYYREKLMFDALKGQEFSQYRKSLLEIIDGKGILEHRHLGIIYRLPYFYIEDIGRQDLLTMGNFAKIDFDGSYVDDVRDLNFVKTIFRSRRHRECNEYWFRDQNNQPVMWEVPSPNNPYAKFIESFLKSKLDTTTRLLGRFSPNDNLYCLKYWKLFNAEVAI